MGRRSRSEVLNGEAARTGETASKTDVTIPSWPHERFFSSLVFDTVRYSALFQPGR